jgi:DNA polymerase-2
MEITGWLLDLYATREGAVLWLIGDDGERHRLYQSFPVTFYAAGPALRLRALWRFLQGQPIPVKLSRTERRELFEGPTTVLAAEVQNPADQPILFRRVAQAFPDLTYYDADVHLALRHAVVHGTFPLARCQLECDKTGSVQSIQVQDSPWDLDPPRPGLRILSIEPDTDPAHAAPTGLLVRFEKGTYCLSLEPVRPLLVNLNAILCRHDPDLLLTTWGDTWLMPRLLESLRQSGLSLPLNRDPAQGAARRPERTYFSYGQVIHRGPQWHLFGRWHLDRMNAMLFHDYGLDGVLEMARITALPVQTAARVSPGTGISAMQAVTASRQGILVPWRNRQAEGSKTAFDLLAADQGGLVYQPTVGVHGDVAEIDFISMYPSIMRRFNLSPETVNTDEEFGFRNSNFEWVPELGLKVDCSHRGLIPETLAPLLDKRLALKNRLAEASSWHPNRSTWKAWASAHKWLLVTCFGYLGYKNARFGRIESHQAVTAYGRECLLRAKEAAEDFGCTVLHMYVDGLWVKKEGAKMAGDFQPILEEIAIRTGLPVALDGIYRWVAFLPSRQDRRVPVANRYFGVFQDGTLKMRGIEARRRDTPRWIAQAQEEMLACLGRAASPTELPTCLPEIMCLLRRKLADLRAGRVPLKDLVVRQKLSRNLEEYRVPSAAARAARQLATVGKRLGPGEYVRFLYTRGEPGVHAWDLAGLPAVACLDAKGYGELLRRSVECVLWVLGC